MPDLNIRCCNYPGENYEGGEGNMKKKVIVLAAALSGIAAVIGILLSRKFRKG